MQCQYCFAKQALQWMPHDHSGRGRPKNTWKRDLEKEMLDSRIQLVEDGGGSTEQSLMEREEWSVVICSVDSDMA